MSDTRKTLVIGATPNTKRQSFKAIEKLVEHGFDVSLIGVRPGKVAGVNIRIGFPHLEDIHTVSIYVGTEKQQLYYNYILGLHPERVIFNPGTNNNEFKYRLIDEGIEVIETCTKLMVTSDRY